MFGSPSVMRTIFRPSATKPLSNLSYSHWAGQVFFRAKDKKRPLSHSRMRFSISQKAKGQTATDGGQRKGT